MVRRAILRALAVLFLTAGAAMGADVDRLRIDLAGAWQAQPVQTAKWDEAAAPPAGPGGWIALKLPAPSWFKDAPDTFKTAPGVWLRRTFDLTADQAALGAVFHWELIRWGFAASVNGKAIGDTLLYAPGDMAVPAGTLRAGANELVLKVRGWDAIGHFGEHAQPLMPAGSAVLGWGSKSSLVAGQLEFRLFDTVRIDSVLMETDLANKKAIAHVELDGPAAQVAVRVLDAAGAELGAATLALAAADPATRSLVCRVEVPLSRVPAWTPENPQMVRAEVTLTAAGAPGRVLDARAVPFGLRTFEARGGRFLLNGEPFRLRGSNLVNDWNWSDERFYNTGGSLKTYLVDTARGMSVNCFRTHTLPPPHSVADICDANGMLLLAEMPLTYNGSPTGLDDAREAEYRANARRMILAWVRELANHPSVITWVPVNEPPMGEKRDLRGWTLKTVYPAIKSSDPTRPILFAAEESPDIQDVHCYSGYWQGAEGEFYEFVERRAVSRDPERPMTNTEYIEGMPAERAFRWTGQTERTPEAELVYAMFGMEQTESMRRLRFDGILPYMFSGWTRGTWRPGYPTPMYAALASALAPVAVSVDLFDRNYAAGAAVPVDVWVVNDTNAAVQAELRVYLCGKNPEYVPATVGEADAVLVKKTSLKIAAGAGRVEKVKVALPATESQRYVAAVLAPRGGKTVMSQREVRVVAPAATPDTVAKRKYRVIGADDEARAWLRARGIRFEEGMSFTKVEPDVDMIVVWQDAHIDAATATMAGWASDYVAQGGRILLLRQERWSFGSSPWWQFPRWDDGDPVSYDTRPDAVSSAYVAPGAADSPLFAGIRKEYLLRWNGQLGAIGREYVTANFLKGVPPASFDGMRYNPSRKGTVVIEGRSATATNFVVDEADERFVDRVDGALRPTAFQSVHGDAQLLLTQTKPADAYTATYDFGTDAPVDGEFWIYEHGRKGSSPFEWRIDDQSFRAAGADAPTAEPRRVHDRKNVWFAWTNCGALRLDPGRHRLTIRVTEPSVSGAYLLEQDLFLIAPRATGETLLVSGSRQPLVVRTEVGKGAALVTQTLFRGRLLKDAPHYDPAAERLLLNFLAF